MISANKSLQVVLLFAMAAALPAFDSVCAQDADAGGPPSVAVDQPTQRAESDRNSLRFSFEGAEWRDVLQWYAHAAGLNLDWQELPDGTLNLMTQQRYSIEEAHNIINRHLLTRGFTLLRSGGALFLAPLDESLNPTMVPRVSVGELKHLPSYDFVRVSFTLDWLLADEAVEELRPLLSPYGEMTPMAATNRIEVMDAVVNLRELNDLLQQEQSDQGQDRLVEEFVLEYANAGEVIEKLRALLGLEVALDRMSRDQMRTAREQYEFRAELIKRLGDKAPRLPKDESDVYIVANERKNSILAHAPPDKIAIIRQATRALDVPSASQERVMADVTTMKVYPMNGVDPDALEEILDDLREIGKLHPNARFSEDDDKGILFVYASLEDHLTIKSVLDQLLASSRAFKVIPLQRLSATYVATSIESLMSGQSNDNDRRRRRGSEPSWGGFRVQPDEPNNRLFLFATEAEFAEVQQLMLKIGERAPSASQVRVVTTPLRNKAEVLNKIRTMWPDLKSNPLHIDVPGYSQSPNPPKPMRGSPDPGAANDARPASPSGQGSIIKLAAQRIHARAAQDPPSPSQPAIDQAAPAGESPYDDEILRALMRQSAPNGDQTAPAVTVRQGQRGEIILRSADQEALDELESLFAEMAPNDQSPFAVYQLEHTSPYSMQLMIEEILTGGSMQLTTPLKIVSDLNTKSLTIFNATEEELARVEEIIDLYDKPQEVDSDLIRKPRFFQLEHAKAEAIAAVIKEIYRDVLSPMDAALASPDRDRDREDEPYQVPITVNTKQPQFKGMLSVGIFVDSNTLVISAPKYLTDEIAETIRRLDRPEASTVAQVVRLKGGVSGRYIAQRLSSILSPVEAIDSTQQMQSSQPRERRPRERQRDAESRDED